MKKDTDLLLRAGYVQGMENVEIFQNCKRLEIQLK